MNASNGSDASTPLKLKTYSNTSTPAPNAAANDRITVPISTSGTTRARRSRLRITNTTSSTSGAISLKSRVAAEFTSSCTAVGPPTRAPGPAAAFTFARSVVMASWAVMLYGSSFSTTWNPARLPACSTDRLSTPATAGEPAAAAIAACTFDAGWTTTSVGAGAPLGE